MRPKSHLAGKCILVVDDEPDILETVEEELDMCHLDKASGYRIAVQYLASYTYDIVILDIMGVNGLELLRKSVNLGFPTVMLTAHPLTPEVLKKSIRLGAVSFLPKNKISELAAFLEDVILEGGKPVWTMLFKKLGAYFNACLGPDWRKKDMFFSEFEEALKEAM